MNKSISNFRTVLWSLACVLLLPLIMGCAKTEGLASKNKPKQVVLPLQSRVFPAELTEQDIMTDLDLLYINDMQAATAGEVISDWPLIKQLSRVSIDLADSLTLANHLNFAFPIEGQPEPPRLLMWVLKRRVEKIGATKEMIEKVVKMAVNSSIIETMPGKKYCW